MFVSMWMTREVVTVEPDLPITEVATLMTRRRIRRVPVMRSPADRTGLLGIIAFGDILHALPSDVNPRSLTDIQRLADAQVEMRTAIDIMTPDPYTTTSDAPIETVARMMRDRKIGALPVLRDEHLIGLITESDLFRAFVAVFESAGQGVRITFDNSSGEDVFPLIAQITRLHNLRVTSFVTVQHQEHPVCVVQVKGTATEAFIEEVWKSEHRVLNVIPIE